MKSFQLCFFLSKVTSRNWVREKVFFFFRNTKNMKYHKEKAYTKILSQYPINSQLNSNYKLLRF